MPGLPYVSVGSSGFLQEINATQASAGVADANKILALAANGLLDPSVLPPGIATDVITGTAFEALAAGDFVYVRSDGQIAKAIATAAATLAAGFVLQAFAAAATATVYLDTKNTALSGLTPGATYFLSGTTAGAVTTVPVTASGQYLQAVGRATSATVLSVEIQTPILRA